MVAAPFLNPAIAWGALAAAAPVIIYLVMRQRYKVVVWAAMEFLLAAYRKTRRRRRIEELLLLAIRTLLLMLLPLGLAHPIWDASGAVIGEEEVHWVIVLDDSYSMDTRERGESAFQRAKAAAQRLVDRLEGRGWVTVIAANALRSGVLPVEANRHDVVKAAIQDMSVSDAGSDLVTCLDDALRAMKERQTVVRHDLFILTDMQRSAWERALVKDPEALQAFEQVGRVAQRVYIANVGAERAANIQVQAFRPSSRTITPGRSAAFEVKVRNVGAARSEETALDFYVGVDESRQKRGGERVPPLEGGEEYTATFVTLFDTPGTYPLTVSLPGDALPVDNSRHFSARARDKIRVLLVEGEPGRSGPEGDETFFLRAALELRPEISPFAVATASYMNFEDEIDLLKHEIIVLANLPSVTLRQAERLERFARDGGILLVTVGENVLRDREGFNAVLYRDGEGILPAGLGEAETAVEPSWIGLAVEPTHAFARASRMDWSPLAEARIRKIVRLLLPPDAGPRVMFNAIDLPLAAGAASRPVLVEKRVGLGACVLFGSAIDADWGFDTVFFPQNGYYPALWYEVLFHFAQSAEKRNIAVGEPFEMILPLEKLSQAVEIQRMDPQAPPPVVVRPTPVENRAKLVYPENPEEARGGGTEASGLYRVTFGAGADEVDYVACNVDPAEGDLRRRLDPGEIATFLPEKFPLTYCANVETLLEHVAGKGSERDLWRPFLIAVFALLCLETVLAWRFGRP